MKNKLITKHQQGTTRGGLVPHQYSGTWGNRGQGNELQSAIENGLSQVGDIIINADDYIEDAFNYGIIGIPALLTGQSEKIQPFVESKREERHDPYTIQAVVPDMPILPSKASTQAVQIFDKLRKAKSSWAVRESQLKKLGQLDKMEETKTAKNWYSLLESYNNEVNKPIKNVITPQKPRKKFIDDVPLSRKLKASFKGNKARSTGDMRSARSGRSFITERQWDQVESLMRKDNNPRAQKEIRKYDLKVAKGIEWTALRKARMQMLQDYLNYTPGYFTWLKK